MRALVNRLLPDGRREKALVDDWPEPAAPTGNQVKVQIVYSGITNGTERNALIGGNYAPADEHLPMPTGYQNVGRVIETGPDVRELQIGDLVYSSADHVEFAVFPEDWLLTRLPDAVDPVHAALFGMASVALNTSRNAELRLGETVLVAGAGFIGQIVAQVALAMGARPTLVDRDAKRLAQAREIDARIETVVTTGDDWDEVLAGREFDAVIDVAGGVGFEDRLLKAVRFEGRVLFIAGRFRVDYDFGIGQAKCVRIKQNSHFSREDLEILTRLVAEGTVRIGPLVQDVVPVAEAGRIYDALRDEPASLFGTVFVW
jgi:2-desacetyl-2-hydroxyethyl bacteriochlorophyllide A dehydrogenase